MVDKTNDSLAELAAWSEATEQSETDETDAQRSVSNHHDHAIDLFESIEFGRRPSKQPHRIFVDGRRSSLTLRPEEYLVYCAILLDTLVSLAKAGREHPEGCSVMTTETGEAYQLLCDLVDGKRGWSRMPAYPLASCCYSPSWSTKRS